MPQQPIPTVQVSLLPATQVKKFQEVTVKQVFKSILRSKEQVTEDKALYEQSLNAKKSEGNKDNSQGSTSPLYLAKNCTLLGSAMISEPNAPYFTYFPARLFTTTPGIGAGVNTSSTTIGKVKLINGSTIESPRHGNSVNNSGGFYSTSRRNDWLPFNEIVSTTPPAHGPPPSPVDPTSLKAYFSESNNGIAFASYNDLDCQISSVFVLSDNQPFSISLTLNTTFSSEQEIKARSKSASTATGSTGTNQAPSTSSTTSSGSPDAGNSTLGGKKPGDTLIPWVECVWSGGSYSAIVFSDGTITVAKDGVILLEKKNLPGGNQTTTAGYYKTTLTFYPLGNYLYIYVGVPTTESTVKNQFLEINTGVPAGFIAGPIVLTWNCDNGFFNFSPILHQFSGLYQSPIVAVPPNYTTKVFNPSFIGKIGVGARGDTLTFPDSGDTNGTYAYLKDNKIDNKTISTASGFSYQVYLRVKNELSDQDVSNITTAVNKSTGDVGDNGEQANQAVNETLLYKTADNIYSPAIYYSAFTFKQTPIQVNTDGYTFDSNDVLNVTVNQTVEGSKATIVLNNRQLDGSKGGKYTYNGSNNYTGIKPIQIQMSFGTAMSTVFTGYTTQWITARSGAMKSELTITCEDIAKKAKEQFAINLPYFDGWCNLGAAYYLLKECGYDDKEIILGDAVQGSIDTHQGGCFDGHSANTPPSDTVHACLPMAILGINEPCYNFTMGTPLWNCLQKIREFTDAFLYPNHLGQIVYIPRNLGLNDSTLVFKEVDTVGAFNEIHNRLEVTCDTSEMRNAVFIHGISFFPSTAKKIEESGWGTHVHIQSDFPTAPNKPYFAPWMRYAYLRNPKWENPARAAYACAKMFQAATKDRTTVTFSAWGQLNLHPYDLFTIDESILQETLHTSSAQYIVTAHTLTANAENHTILSNICGEFYDGTNGSYDPSFPPERRR